MPAVQTHVGDRRDNQRRDGAAIVASVLRSARLIQTGAPLNHNADSPAHPICVGRVKSHTVSVGTRKIPWDSIRPHLRDALELDRPEKLRSADARYLAEFLHAEKPSLLQFVLARKRLNQIWHALKHQMQ